MSSVTLRVELFEVEGVSQQECLPVALERGVPEVGNVMNVVAQFMRQPHCFEPRLLRRAVERAGALTVPKPDAGRCHQGRDLLSRWRERVRPVLDQQPHEINVAVFGR
jgi:hypothetical protein